MLPFEEALGIVLNSARPLGAERANLADASGRVLAEDVKSDMDIPPFNKSAMDGYACRRADLAGDLELIETIPAGYTPTKPVGPGQCSKIMTGAVVPEGADCVVMKEYVEAPRPNVVRLVREKTAGACRGRLALESRAGSPRHKDNICLKGENVKTGDVVLHKGTVLKPQHIAVLASVGQARPKVSKMPRVGIVATGSELVDPSCVPEPSQIRNSNSFQLAAQAGRVGVPVTNYGIVEDTRETIDEMFVKIAADNDVVILSGGVSVGDFDLVPGILKRNNVDLLFESVAVKPGKPSVFGVSDDVYCFGLPGNPMATFVQFEILVKPFLYKLMGCEYRRCVVHMPLGDDIVRTDTERQDWIPVAATDAGTVKPVEYHGSAHISSLYSADGMTSIDAGLAVLKKGTIVPVRLI